MCPDFRCPDCNKKVSTKADSCPKCGNYDFKKVLCSAFFCHDRGTESSRYKNGKVYLHLQNGSLLNEYGFYFYRPGCPPKPIFPESGLVTEDTLRWEFERSIYTWREIVEFAEEEAKFMRRG